MLSSSKKVVVTSKEGYEFQITDIATALQCKLLKCMIEDVACTFVRVPLSTVNTSTMVKVLEYCQKHAHAAADGGASDDADMVARLKTWDAEFVGVVDTSMLYDLAMAAKYLEIPSLFDLTWGTLAKRESVEEIRYAFDLRKNDFLGFK